MMVFLAYPETVVSIHRLVPLVPPPGTFLVPKVRNFPEAVGRAVIPVLVPCGLAWSILRCWRQVAKVKQVGGVKMEE
jgi:hypothetical protein